MKRISPERKTAALDKLLPPYNMTVTAVAQMEGISEATLYNWRNQAKAEGKPVPGADNRTVRYDWLGQHLFSSLKALQEYATQWQWFYHHERLNMALNGFTPMQRIQCLSDSTDYRR